MQKVNQIFQKWTAKATKKRRLDYNHLVDKILFLSKTYNINNEEKQLAKKEVKIENSPPRVLSRVESYDYD